MSVLRITTIQSILHWEEKEANLRMFEEKIANAGPNPEIVLLPEMFNTGFSMNPVKLAEKMDGPSIQWMKQIAQQHNIILAGSLIIEDDKPGEHGPLYYNRLVWMLPNGQYGCYDKRHLFAYGNEHQQFSAGNKRLIASVKGWRIHLLVCYDLRFPVWSRQSSSELAEPEYDVLVYVANWPEKRIHAWKTLVQARAIENQCYVVAVNRVGNDGHGIYHSGDTMVVDAMGEILYTKTHEEDVHTIALQKASLEEIRKKLPFLADRDDFKIGL